MKYEFEKTFGPGVDPWYAKMERWANKQPNQFVKFFSLGFIAWLKRVWFDLKVEHTMRDVDVQVDKLHEHWDEQEKSKVVIKQEPSEVEGLDNFSIEAQYAAFERAARDHDEVIEYLNNQKDEE